MSFASDVKEEICKSQTNNKCCIISEIYGILLMSSNFSHTHIKITTENTKIAKRVQYLFKRAFKLNVVFIVKNNKLILELDNPLEIEKIFDEFGYDHKYYINYNLHRNIVDNKCCVASFLKGAFLMGGTVNSPEKKSHLEISTSHSTLAREILSLMLDNEMKPKVSKRKNHHVIYFKDSIEVEDFLTRIKATNSAMKIMEAKAIKEIRNSVNRRVNCETANLSKTIDAAMKQIKVINQAVEKYGIDYFPKNLHLIINLRINNPELSLTELGELHSPELSKSAINHRMRKILDIAQKES